MTTWAVVPVKVLSKAKQRLGARLSAAQRTALAREMLEVVLDALAGARSLGGVIVVSADDEARSLARDRGFLVLDEPTPGGLDAAVRRAAEWLTRRRIDTMLVVASDLAAVTPADIEALLAAHPGGRALTLAPSHDRAGTNAMVVSPPLAIRPAYGIGSFVRHLEAGRAATLGVAVVERPALALDVDLPCDLDTLARWRGCARPVRSQPVRAQAAALS